MRSISATIALCLAACSAGAPARPPPESADPAPSAPAYTLNEWGVISATGTSFEVAAGPGRRAVVLTVDKPVLYVHPAGDSPFELSLRVDLPSGLEVAEHYPPTETSPLRWRARVAGSCEGSYPSVEDSRCPDGYCEVGELSTYETSDAACLEVGGVRVPLLFYRLRAEGEAPAMPLAVTRDGDEMVVRNVALGEAVGSLLRVTFDGSSVQTTRAEIPEIGESVRLAAGHEPVEPARAAIRAELTEHGLRDSERDAFMRAWDTALFGPTAVDGDDGVTDEVDRLGASAVDGLTTLAGPRQPDALLYWLDPAAIDRLARITADPEPAEVHRAYLVRVAP